MGERYSRLFTYKENTYAEGSPVIISAGALLNDAVTNNIIAQLKFRSISEVVIKALTVELKLFDTAGRETEAPITYQYLDLKVTRNDEFGSKQPIVIPDRTTRAFTVRVTEVIFNDNAVWNGADAKWEKLPDFEQQAIPVSDIELQKQFELEYGIIHKNDFCEFKDLWYCPCGEINKGDICHNCKFELNKVKSTDYEALKANCDERLEQERIKAERIAEELKQQDEVRAKKIKKAAMIVTPIVCILAVLVIVLTTVIIPTVKKNIFIHKKNNFIQKYGQEVYDTFGLVAEGEYITLGSFEQDDNKDNGKEEIEWLVLEVQEDRALVISKYILDSAPYHDDLYHKNITWETSTIRKWLNSGFLNTAFNAEQSNWIVSVNTTNNYTEIADFESDKLFLLSVEDIHNYFKSYKDCACKPTEYACWRRGVHSNCHGIAYWLRNRGSGDLCEETSCYFPGAAYNCKEANIEDVIWETQITISNGVRPAMWISLK